MPVLQPLADARGSVLLGFLRALLEDLARLLKLTEHMAALKIRTPAGMGLGLLGDVVDPADEVFRVILGTSCLAAFVKIDRTCFCGDIGVIDRMLRLRIGSSNRHPAASVDGNSLADRAAVARFNHLAVEVH